jgi:predicted O-methyltransferase YrrM
MIITFSLYYFKIVENAFFSKNDFDVYFKYNNYQREMITNKMKKYSSWQLLPEEPYFINGIIRKYKPKKCLEIGVASGGSSSLILNAIKDIKNSFLVSLDINTLLYQNNKFKTGYIVFKYFPELTNKWKLYTGEQPHKFLEKLQLKFDFLFLDTVHFSPGEIINLIEVLPFLEKNAIIVLHDINIPMLSAKVPMPKFHPSNILLMSALNGDKVFLDNKERYMSNIGAIHLYTNQKKYYLNYFLLLLAPWDYIPNEKLIQELKEFIKKYYKEEIYLNLFNIAIEENRKYVNRFKKIIREKNPLVDMYKLIRN